MCVHQYSVIEFFILRVIEPNTETALSAVKMCSIVNFIESISVHAVYHYISHEPVGEKILKEVSVLDMGGKFLKQTESCGSSEN